MEGQSGHPSRLGQLLGSSCDLRELRFCRPSPEGRQNPNRLGLVSPEQKENVSVLSRDERVRVSDQGGRVSYRNIFLIRADAALRHLELLFLM